MRTMKQCIENPWLSHVHRCAGPPAGPPGAVVCACGGLGCIVLAGSGLKCFISSSGKGSGRGG